MNSQHSLFDAGVVGQPLNQNAVNLIYDFNVAAEQADPNAAGTLVVYANSEDGNLYAISQGGTMLQRIFQQLAIGAAYTPASLDSSGRIYSQNDGHLFIVTK